MLGSCAVLGTRCALAGLGRPARPSQASRSCHHSDSSQLGQRAFPWREGSLREPGSSRGNSLSHWEGKPCLEEASAASGSWLYPSCIAAVGSSCLLSDIAKYWLSWCWQHHANEPLETVFNPMHSLGCLHPTSPWRWHSQRASGMNTALRLQLSLTS